MSSSSCCLTKEAGAFAKCFGGILAEVLPLPAYSLTADASLKGTVLAGSSVHDIMMNLHLSAITTFMTGVGEVNNASVCDTVVHGPSSSSAMPISHDPLLQPYSLAMLSNILFVSITNFCVGFSRGISTGILLRRLDTQVPSFHP